jgi:hypothetical protein
VAIILLQPLCTELLPSIFFNFPLYLQSVPIHSANVVKSCRRVLTSTLLYLMAGCTAAFLALGVYVTIYFN